MGSHTSSEFSRPEGMQESIEGNSTLLEAIAQLHHELPDAGFGSVAADNWPMQLRDVVGYYGMELVADVLAASVPGVSIRFIATIMDHAEVRDCDECK